MPTGESPDTLWTGDVDEAAIEDWTAETTTFDRVRHVIDVTTEPQSVAAIAERARVSEPTARKYLDALSEAGRVKAIETESGTRYMRSPQLLAMQRIAAIHREHTKDDIRDAIRELKDELQGLREAYDVADVDELTVQLEPGDDGWQDVARWQQVTRNLEIAHAALSLYDFDPDDSRSAAARIGDASAVGDSTEGEGALGGDTVRTA